MNYYLLLCLGACHTVADYFFPTGKMLDANRFGKPFGPIFLHALDHGYLMFITMMSFRVNPIVATCLFLMQIAVHFVIDVLKGRMNTWFPVVASPANKQHWIVFGVDQFLHFATIVAMMAIIG